MFIGLHSGSNFGSIARAPPPPDPILLAAETFLWERMGDRYYGPGLRHIVLDFRDRLPKNRAPKATWRYRGTFAEHLLTEVVGWDLARLQLTAETLRHLLLVVLEATLATRELWQGEFRAEQFATDFDDLLRHAPATDADWLNFARELDQRRPSARLKVLSGEETHRRATPRPLDTPFVGLRCFDHGTLKGRLAPHLSIQWRLVEGLLRQAELKCPRYREIYINLAPTLEEARRERKAIEDWHENAYATLDLAQYEAASDEARSNLVLDAIERGLNELAALDQLDQATIRLAVSEARRTGLATDLRYRRAENKTHEATIVYRVAADGGDPHFRLEVLDRQRDRRATVDLGRRDLWWLPYSFAKLTLRKDEVRIEGRRSERARISRQVDQLPDTLRFPFRELFDASETHGANSKRSINPGDE